MKVSLYAYRKKFYSVEEFWSVVVALDFGTTYSGYAFWKKDTDPLDITSGKWKTGSKDVLESLKTPTSLLLNKENEVIEFGFEAEQIFKELVKDGNDKEYRFFRQFKMHFYLKKVPLIRMISIFLLFYSLKQLGI